MIKTYLKNSDSIIIMQWLLLYVFEERKNSEFKPAVLHLRIDLVSHTASCGGSGGHLVNTYKGHTKSSKPHQEKRT